MVQLPGLGLGSGSGVPAQSYLEQLPQGICPQAL
jgi:hypothetical protein